MAIYTYQFLLSVNESSYKSKLDVNIKKKEFN